MKNVTTSVSNLTNEIHNCTAFNTSLLYSNSKDPIKLAILDIGKIAPSAKTVLAVFGLF